MSCMRLFRMINLIRKKLKVFQQILAELTKEVKVSKKALFVIALSALCLVFIRYLTSFNELILFLELVHLSSIGEYLTELRNDVQDKQLFDLIYWTICRVFFYLIIPILSIKLILNQKISDFGWRLSANFKKDLKIFFVFFGFMFPLVFWVSTQESFLVKYPFYRPSSEDHMYPNLFIWEIFYFLQFISLEFFFRGFLVHGLKKEIGDYSVLVMVIPYCMIHFQKPFLETIGAIFAGLILGYLSLRKNSIVTGIALHFSVAITMDVFALYHLGYI